MAKSHIIENWKHLRSLGWNVPEGGILPPRPKAPPAPPKAPADKQSAAKEKE